MWVFQEFLQVEKADNLQEKFHAEFLLTSISDKYFYLLRKQQL